MDGLPHMTLFLHEDILARTLAYEQDLRQWRISELEAGRSDPGRPKYEEVQSLSFIWCFVSLLQAFGGTPNSITQHRCHAGDGFSFFLRNEGSDLVPNPQIYSHVDCPGFDNPTSLKHFPVINTLLSIPFSLLHNLPRMAGIAPISAHQRQLVAMGAEIVALWWWDPSPDMIENAAKIRLQNSILNQHNETRNPKPDHIHHPSRRNTTFSTKQPLIPLVYGTPITHSSSCNPNEDADTFKLPSGRNLLGTTTPVSWDEDGILLTPRDEGFAITGDVQLADQDIFTGAPDLPLTYEIRDETITSTDDSDDIDAIEDGEGKPLIRPASFDILSWYEKISDSAPEPLPLTHGSFERGVIGGLCVNDILMIRELIPPPVYIQFFDLSSFSCL
jgi:hypothetical protein